MSSMTRESQTSIATVWYKQEAANEYSGIGQGVTYNTSKITVCFMQGGSSQFSDSQGVLFTPEGQFWFETLGDANPHLGDYIAIGDYVATTDPSEVDTAKEIRKAELQDCSSIGELDDFYVVT